MQMQKRAVYWVIAFVALYFVRVHIAYANDIREIREVMFDGINSINLKQPRYLISTTKNDLWMVYTSVENEIVAIHIPTKAKIVINPKGEGQPSGTAVCETNGKMHFVWRSKTDKKSLEFRTLDLTTHTLGEKITIDKSTEPLTRIKIGCNDKIISIVWYGEKSASKHRRYSIYASQSVDGGVKFSEAFDVTPETMASIYPSLVIDELGNSYVFTEVVKKDDHEMVFRKLANGVWETPVSIGKVGTVSLYIRPIKIENRLAVFWFNNDNRVPLTEMAYSEDGFNNWNRYVFESSRNLDLTGMQVAGGGDHIYLVLSAVNIKEKENSDDPRKVKDQLFFFYSHDKGKTFLGPVPIRHDPFGSYTRAHLPNIVANGKNVVVVWNDYRNIRANLYMNYSKDGGITWQPKDIPLEEPGKYNTVLHWDVNNLIEHNGAYYVLAHRFKDDAMEVAYPVLISFKIVK